jgi:hypothetical protein
MPSEGVWVKQAGRQAGRHSGVEQAFHAQLENVAGKDRESAYVAKAGASTTHFEANILLHTHAHTQTHTPGTFHKSNVFEQT